MNRSLRRLGVALLPAALLIPFTVGPAGQAHRVA